MVRPADPERPAELLDAIADYLLTHGLTDLSLRPLAAAVQSSPRALLYHFGSKEALVVKALARLRERQRKTFARLRATRFDSPAEACRAIWRQMSAPAAEPAFRLFFETYALALRHPRQFADFRRSAVEEWLDFLAAPLTASGQKPDDARAFATVVLAGFRGFLMDYCATGDRRRVNRAVDLWLESLNRFAVGRPGSA
jgi:AcrR family transcriptional regulator